MVYDWIYDTSPISSLMFEVSGSHVVNKDFSFLPEDCEFRNGDIIGYSFSSLGTSFWILLKTNNTLWMYLLKLWRQKMLHSGAIATAMTILHSHVSLESEGLPDFFHHSDR